MSVNFIQLWLVWAKNGSRAQKISLITKFKWEFQSKVPETFRVLDYSNTNGTQKSVFGRFLATFLCRRISRQRCRSVKSVLMLRWVRCLILFPVVGLFCVAKKHSWSVCFRWFLLRNLWLEALPVCAQSISRS